MKILDEAHHLTTNNMALSKTTKKYIQMLNILSNKQLSLTATLKQLENTTDINVVSNSNVKYFGEIIDRRCLTWAIKENIICDYVIQTINTNHEQFAQQLAKFEIIEENDKRMYLSAHASLKSIFDGCSHHLFIYSNNKENSLKIIQYIKMLLDNKYFDMPNLYYSNYHSNMKSSAQKDILDKFKNAKNGIITCVYCLAEGFDFPLLDGVVFAENMTSNIRIVQSALRASRKNKNEPNKITKIILPILNNESSDLKKVKEVIHQMGLEDETITQKISALTINIGTEKVAKNENKNITNAPSIILDKNITDCENKYVNNMPNLDLCENKNITDDGIKHINNITSLKLCENNNITVEEIKNMNILTSHANGDNKNITDNRIKNIIKELKYKNDTIMTITDNDNNVWFNGYQACIIIGYKDPKNIIKKLVHKKHIKYLKDVINDYRLYPNAQPKSIYLHEAGLYTLMIRSKKENAEKFLLWITENIIPSMRKNDITAQPMIRSNNLEN